MYHTLKLFDFFMNTIYLYICHAKISWYEKDMHFNIYVVIRHLERVRIASMGNGSTEDLRTKTIRQLKWKWNKDGKSSFTRIPIYLRNNALFPIFVSHRVWLTLNEFISPWCRIYASVTRVSIGSGNGLSPIRHQAITRSNAHFLSLGP